MINFTHSDERYPLLMFVGDEEDSRTTSTNNKRGRFRNISAGAASVMNQWPGHMTSCWLTTLLVTIGSTIVAIFIILLAVRNGVILGPYCDKSKITNSENGTVHLIHDFFPWCQEQLEIVEKIAKSYPDWNIELILIKNMNDVTESHNGMSSLKYHNRRRVGKSIENNSVSTVTSWVDNDHLQVSEKSNSATGYLKMLFHIKRTNKENCEHCSSFQDVEQLVQQYPFVKISCTTFEDIFQNTPLYFTWQNLNLKTKIFAARVLYLWEDAGVTYEIPQLVTEEIEDYNVTLKNRSLSVSPCIDYKREPLNPEEVQHLRKINLVERFIQNENKSFKSIPAGVVTIDDEGVHMETKTPCHAFLGELIIRLRQATKDSHPKDIMMTSLKKFCIKGGVQSQYCQKF